MTSPVLVLEPVVNNEVTVIGIGAIVKDNDSKKNKQSKQKQRNHHHRRGGRNRNNNNNINCHNNHTKEEDGSYTKKPDDESPCPSSDDSTCTTVSSSSQSSIEGTSGCSDDPPMKKGTVTTDTSNNTNGKKNRRRRNRGVGVGERRKQQQKKKQKKGRGKNSATNDQVVEDVSSIEKSQYVALDCEMVGVTINNAVGGRYGTTRREVSSVARVTLVGWDGNVILDEYIKQIHEVTDYRTFVSGITPHDLSSEHNNATLMTLDECTFKVKQLLEGKILIGHALKNDLKVLNISHPWYMIRDTAKYEPFQQVRFDDGILWPRKLKDLVKQKLDGRAIQVEGLPHCPIEDAMAAFDLYKLARKKWEKAMEYKINKTKEIQQQNNIQY